MKIIDINGHEIEIIDLRLMLLQADDYRHYRLSDPALSEKMQAYWEDLYRKLLKLTNDGQGTHLQNRQPAE
jgi:hypothetical protein